MTNQEQINRRRTFAIISHPDAGKTTLTEKFLLYGGAIQSAGSVKGKASDRHAVSDWMEVKGHPHHPLYLKSNTPLEPFDTLGYLDKLC